MKKLDIAAIVYSIFFAIISVLLIVSTYITRQTYAHDNVTVTTAARVVILCLIAIHILFICTVRSRAAQITVTCTMLPILVMIYQTLGYIIVPQTAYILAYVIIHCEKNVEPQDKENSCRNHSDSICRSAHLHFGVLCHNLRSVGEIYGAGIYIS